VRDESDVLGFGPPHSVVTSVDVALNRRTHGCADELHEGLRLLNRKEILFSSYLEQNAPQNEELFDQLRNVETEPHSGAGVLLRGARPHAPSVSSVAARASKSSRYPFQIDFESIFEVRGVDLSWTDLPFDLLEPTTNDVPPSTRNRLSESQSFRLFRGVVPHGPPEAVACGLIL
jgi:hypothetical protein